MTYKMQIWEVRKLPRISNFGGMTIVIYYNDHDPPHFHIIYNEIQTRIDIRNGTYLKGNVPLPRAKEKDILYWLELHRDDMMNAWKDCMEKKQPSKILPLY